MIQSHHSSKVQCLLESFEEQKLVLKTCVKGIDSYRNINSKLSFTKSIGIHESSRGGNTWCVINILSYAISKENVVITTTMMCKRALQLGGIHIHQLFKLPTDNMSSAHRKAELAILALLRNPENYVLSTSYSLMKWVKYQMQFWQYFI